MPRARSFLKTALPFLLAFLWIFCPGLHITGTTAAERPFGIALLGDPHLPGRELPAKESLLQTINGWDDIDRVVVLGDICKSTGTAAEYAVAKEFFSRLDKPIRLIAGNHDYIYEDEANSEGRAVKASPATRRQKLARFAETFGMKEIYGSERVGNYLLVYLSTDDLESGYLAKLSEERVAWLAALLARYRDLPTIVFFHAPLAGTLKTYNEYANAPGFIAQPAIRLYEAIR